LVAHFRGVMSVGTLGEMHVFRDGYVGIASVGDGVTNVALVVPKQLARTMAGDTDAFLHAWLKKHPALAHRFALAERVSPVRATGPFASHAKHSWAPGAALVGDAADFFDPFTGEGIYSALRGGQIAAPFIVDAVTAIHRGRLDMSVHALKAYEHARGQTFAGKWRVERLISAAVAVPSVMNVAARLLGRNADVADLLIGVTGDFVPASALLSPQVLARLLIPRLRRTSPRVHNRHPAPTASMAKPEHA